MMPGQGLAAIALILCAVAASLVFTATAAMAETVTVDGHRVWYRVDGDPASAPAPILLLHGGMMNTDLSWSDMIPRLSQDRAVIGIDQQGHGHTADRPTPITLASMRADTLAVIDALQIDRAHVVGFSLGGMLGLDMAVNAPDRVASLSVISAGQNGDGFLAELVLMNRDPSHVPSPDLVPLLPSPKDFLDMRRGYQDRNPGASGAMVPAMHKLGALLNSDWGFSDDQIGAIGVPVMVLIGDHDFIRPAHAVHMAETIPGAWLTVLPDSTHIGVLDRPELPDLVLDLIASAEGD